MSQEKPAWKMSPEQADYAAATDLLLPPDEASVKDDLKKIAKGKPMSPVLVVCGDMAKGLPLVVADGYHRICAVCHYDEFSPVATKMVEN